MVAVNVGVDVCLLMNERDGLKKKDIPRPGLGKAYLTGASRQAYPVAIVVVAGSKLTPSNVGYCITQLRSSLPINSDQGIKFPDIVE